MTRLACKRCFGVFDAPDNGFDVTFGSECSEHDGMVRLAQAGEPISPTEASQADPPPISVRTDVRCVFCGEKLNSNMAYRGIVGWEKPRSGGGANQIVLRKVMPGRFACDTCISLRRHGINDAQESLL